MIKNFTRSERKLHVFHELCFDDGNGNGFGFPCDESGNVFPLEFDAAKKNLESCMAHPEKFTRWKEVVTYKNWYTEPAHGRCHCGEEVFLIDRYFGACDCPKCGQWYNLFGEELLPPSMWGEDMYAEDW